MDNAELARNVAKWLAVSIIDLATTQAVANTVADRSTRFEKDDLIVKLGAGAVGMVVSAKLKPVTDKMVDKAADFASEQWTKRRPKKDNQKQEEK